MITLSELKKLAVKEGVPQAVIEKDIALSVTLATLSGSKLVEHVVFKGGTAIRKAYFKEARFSEDLDFTAVGIEQAECLRLLRKTLEGLAEAGITFEKVEAEKTTAGLKALIKYSGPLAYAQRIRFDFDFRENLAEKPARRKLLDPYGLGDAELLILSLEEIFAEKLHALGSRSTPRDLYDAWFLFGKGVRVDRHVLDRKFAYYGEKFDVGTAIENARKSKATWLRDLRHLVKALPEFERVEHEVEKRLKEIR